MKKICHLLYLDKFSKPFYQFIKNCFDNREHLFITYGEVNSHYAADFSQLHLTNRFFYFIRAIPNLTQSDKIILHGAFSTKLMAFLMFQPWLWKKIYWVIWGKDLQFFVNNSKGLPYFIRRFVLSKVKGYVTYLPEDYEKAKHLLQSKSLFKECIAYPSNIVSSSDSVELVDAGNKIVMVGNSADPSNYHFQVFEKLNNGLNNISRVIVPLSYGDKIYASHVIKEGKALFGEKFHPLTTMLSIENYQELLKSVDLAFFNHDRQQAMGNIIYLLSLGKTVFMRENTPSWHFFKSKGVIIKSIDCDSFDYISHVDAINNMSSVVNYFNEKNLVKQWAAIFNE